MVQLGTDLRLLIIMSVIALVWVATFSRLKFFEKRPTGSESWAVGKSGKIRYQLFLHKRLQWL